VLNPYESWGAKKFCNDFLRDAQAHGLTRGDDARRIPSHTSRRGVVRNGM